MPGSQFNPMPNDRPGELERRVRDLERLVQEMAAARTLENASITAAAGLGIRTSDFDGTSFANPGTHGNYFGGDGAILTNLLLRPGAIINDWLQSPVKAGFLFNSINTFGLSTTMTNIQTVNVTIPAGFTSLACIIIGRVYATNNTAGLDYLYGQTNVNGYNGNSYPLPVSASGGTGTNVSPFAVLLTGLTPGASVSFQMAAQTAFGPWASSASNGSELNGLLLWFR
jgi:hypothetical protein